MENEQKTFEWETWQHNWKDWCVAILLTLSTGFLWLVYGLSFDHGEGTTTQATIEERLIYARIAGFVTAAAWGIVATRTLLGHGKKQKETIQHAISSIASVIPKPSSNPKDFLVRASNSEGVGAKELLHPAKEIPTNEAEELLRPDTSDHKTESPQQ